MPSWKNTGFHGFTQLNQDSEWGGNSRDSYSSTYGMGLISLRKPCKHWGLNRMEDSSGSGGMPTVGPVVRLVSRMCHHICDGGVSHSFRLLQPCAKHLSGLCFSPLSLHSCQKTSRGLINAIAILSPR